jgi:DNA-binding LacI/PurR family transcriptional regulator
MLIGAVLEHVTTPFGLEMMYRMDSCAKDAGYRLILRFSYGDREKETEEIRFLLEQDVSGLIIMPSHGEHYSSTILKLSLEGFPVVMVDKKLTGIPLPSVRTDNSAAVATLVSELQARGAKRICFFYRGYDDVISVQERKNGFMEEARRLGLNECQMLALPAEANAESFLSSTPSPEAVLELKKHLTGPAEYGIVSALVCAAKELNLKIGEDFRVACIDEDALAPFGYTFMHMKQDESAIAEKAIALLLDRMAGNTVPQESHLIPAIFYAGERKAEL